MDLTTITIAGLAISYLHLLWENWGVQQRLAMHLNSSDEALALAVERGELVDDLRGLLRDLGARTAILHAQMREEREAQYGVRSLRTLTDDSPEVEVGSIQAQIARVLEATEPEEYQPQTE